MSNWSIFPGRESSLPNSGYTHVIDSQGKEHVVTGTIDACLEVIRLQKGSRANRTDVCSLAYHGFSYSGLFDWGIVLAIWRRTFCRLGVHLLDEVVTDAEHFLHCDACGCAVHVRTIVTADGRTMTLSNDRDSE